MKNSTYKLLVTILSLIIVIGGAVLLYQNFGDDVDLDALNTRPADTAVDAAPDFTVEDGQGNEVSLSDFLGKPVIVNFWASTCGPCKLEMPHFQSAWETYGEEIQFMMVNLTDGLNDTYENASALIRENGYTFPVFFDTARSGAIAYQITGMPVTYFINARGEIVHQQLGMMTAEQLEQAIAGLLPD